MTTKAETKKQYFGLSVLNWMTIGGLILIVIAIYVIGMRWSASATTTQQTGADVSAGRPGTNPEQEQMAGNVTKTSAPAARQGGGEKQTAKANPYQARNNPTNGDQAWAATITPIADEQEGAQPVADARTPPQPATDGQPKGTNVEAKSTVNDQLADQLKQLNKAVTHLQDQIATIKSESRAQRNEDAKKIKTLHGKNKKLTHALARSRQKANDLKSKVKARSALPGWRVTAVNGDAAVLSGPNGAVKLVHVGDKLFGVKITAIDVNHGTVKTDAGVLRRH
jgi:uncharacterized phage infection (PIP) family protein YhgE